MADRYRSAGVDLDSADRIKHQIAELVASTRTGLARGMVGGFGGMVRIPDEVDRPVLVMSTDGVGTKVLVAIRADRSDSIGEDLVNHSVNDILVHGATPLAFLDYIAGVRVPAETITSVVDGIARACRAHGMTLAGGETAELPGLYQPGHFDLAGTIVGVVAEDEALHADRVAPGDVLVGYEASGLHTNGYTLARQIVFDQLGLDVDSEIAELGATVGNTLLTVHRSYWRAVAPALPHIHSLAHITGGGIAGNLARALPSGCGAVVERAAWPVPAVFTFLEDAGQVSTEEMVRVFNMGVGMIALAPREHLSALETAARDADVATWEVGEVVAGDGVTFR